MSDDRIAKTVPASASAGTFGHPSDIFMKRRPRAGRDGRDERKDGEEREKPVDTVTIQGTREALAVSDGGPLEDNGPDGRPGIDVRI